MSELQDIVTSVHHAFSSGDEQMKRVAMQDLNDAAELYENLELICRFVAKNGDRVLMSGYLPDSVKVREINGVQNQVLIDKYNKILKSKMTMPEFFKIFKHLNDMSPEEYAWCEGVEQ